MTCTKQESGGKEYCTACGIDFVDKIDCPKGLEMTAPPLMTAADTSAARVAGYAKWHEREAASLRATSQSPSMPELAEMHEETAATLRALLAERDAANEAVLDERDVLKAWFDQRSLDEPYVSPVAEEIRLRLRLALDI